MSIDAAMYNGPKCFFFSGRQYIRVTRGDTGPGTVDPGYPKIITEWKWGDFGKERIDAAMYRASKCYFFSGSQYIRVTRTATEPMPVDSGYPKSISQWGWGGPGANGIDAAMYNVSKFYFFIGDQYLRVTGGQTGPGTVDAGYPKPISEWGWDGFGQHGIDAALYSGTKCYFFSGSEYIRVTRTATEPMPVDSDYPKSLSQWGWPSSFPH